MALAESESLIPSSSFPEIMFFAREAIALLKRRIPSFLLPWWEKERMRGN